MPTSFELPLDCTGVGDVLSVIGDKWTVQIIVALHRQPKRFNAVKREVAGISQQMLIRTLKVLERDGMVLRTLRDTTPPQVIYSLTTQGLSLSEPVRQLAAWAVDHRASIRDSRDLFDARHLESGDLRVR